MNKKLTYTVAGHTCTFRRCCTHQASAPKRDRAALSYPGIRLFDDFLPLGGQLG